MDHHPGHRDDQQTEEVRIESALESAIDSIANWMLCDPESEPAWGWVDRMYDDLRGSLTQQELIRALLSLLKPRAQSRASNLVDQFRMLPTARKES